MKKIYLLLPFFFLASCSTIEETPEDTNPILLTKMVQNGENFTFSYNRTKIVEMKNTTDNFRRAYTYTGDLITKYVDTYSDNSTQTTNITYNSNNKITKKTSTYSGVTYTTTYNYVGADKVNIVSIAAGGNFTKTYTIAANLNADGSLKNWTETVSDVQPSGTANGTGSLQTVVYDGGNNPFKNVTGYTRLLDGEEEISGSLRNVVNYKHIIHYPATMEYTVYQSTFEYDTMSGFPKKEIRDNFNSSGAPTTTEITTYEYNHL
ncbi:hypothetical protein SAMN05421664_1522 [Chryseobacterium soldanellicola]|uniref:YD repeat-containing protein n=1 Tax=Chryseobacterium soldanellicola TaxID=311333 RepID=A0A1H1AP40_9FLAO|nr:hypothetical protein [Chryseobacterium soldanellicola]SDQ41523.1 hypothetical protein SAMN05421664_1522 [Chryseobacterium soldanellicola]